MNTIPDHGFSSWLDTHADALDTGTAGPETLLPQLTQAGLPHIGVPAALGGKGGQLSEAIAALAAVAQHSLTAAFVLWGHRTFIEYLVQSPNHALAARLLPALLAGRLAGATGLSNAMKYLGGIEQLQATVEPVPNGFTLNGTLPWVTNLRKEGYVVALAADNAGTGAPGIFAVAHDAAGVTRSEDLDLMALRSSNTAAVSLRNVALGEEWQIHPHAKTFLPAVRPAFLGLQCGLALGLARASLATVRAGASGNRSILAGGANALTEAVEQQWQRLAQGADDGTFREQPRLLFDIRIELAGLAVQAVQLELQARGGRAYLLDCADGFGRRWRESAFLPIVTPSLVQLKTELARHRPAVATP